MIREKIMEELKDIMIEILGDDIDLENITEEAVLTEDFDADSLQVVEIVSRLMKKVKIKVRRTELSKPANIGELITLLKATQEAQGE